MGSASHGEIALQLVDGALQELAIPLKLFDLLSMRMRRFLRSSVLLRIRDESGQVSPLQPTRRTHPPRLSNQIPQLLGFLALRRIIAFHPFVGLATSLQRLGELGDVALERADLGQVLLLGAAELLLLATLDEQLSASLRESSQMISGGELDGA